MSYEEYEKEYAFEKAVFYKSLTGRDPSAEELLEFLLSEYDDYMIHNEIRRDDEFR